MLESLVRKFNDRILESAYIIPEYSIEEVKSELGQYGIEIDESKEEGATIIEDKAFTWNIFKECLYSTWIYNRRSYSRLK